ncbi:unnamed protein product [Cuscuta campestris]|uniref:CID domain-containing protein n=1 Tax=Cuscuta campestris TaxID=132261 RepID=A0A484LY25_9ASTE|nr:unnamed protein product [Cuscuta campestris]
MPNDSSAGISKPAPPSILERFRAMLKERDEEIRVSSEDGAVSPPTIDEVVRLYDIVLSDLTFNSKPIITDLTIIAGEHTEHGEGITDAICARILEAPVDQKLPSLYLLDSIVKNIGREYIRHFAARLPEVFCEAYRQVHPNMFPALRHLFGTWSTVFPSSVLNKIEACLQFSPSTSHQSSGLTNMRASESPRPGHGIHVNPKYLEARRKLVGAEKLSSAGRAGHVSSDIDALKLLPSARPSSPPYGVGRARSLSPPADDFDAENSRAFAERSPPSHGRIDCGVNGVLAGDNETIEWHKNLMPDNGSQRLENSAACSFKKEAGLQGPRALVNAYGIDEREKEFNYQHHKIGQPNANGISKKAGVRTWQSTEEEEFNWENMSPTLGDAHRHNDASSSMLPPGRYITRPHVGSLQDISAINESRRRLSDQAHPSLVKPVPGATDKITGLYEEVPLIPAPNYSQESRFLQQDFPQSSHHHMGVEGGGRALTTHPSESRNSTSVGELKPSLVGNLTNVDGKFWRPPSNNSSLANPGFNLSIQDAQAVNVGLSNGTWTSMSMHNSRSLNPMPMLLPQKQIRDQFDTMSAVPGHAQHERHMDNIDTKPQFEMPRLSVQHPSAIPLNLQRSGQIGLSQPLQHFQDFPLTKGPPSSIVVPTRMVMPHFGYPHRGHGVSGVQMVNIPNNTSLQFPGAALLPPITRFPIRAAPPPQMMPTLQTSGQVSQSSAPPQSGAFSNLISTLMAQGLISLTNQATTQDSIGTEFNVEVFKERHESTITALYSALPRQCTTCGLRFKSQDTHSSHMDWHVTKNRISKNRKHKPSRKWYVSLSMWLSSAEALGTDAVPGFPPVEDAVEKKDDEELAVPADDDQNACALCGEPFDDFYSDENEEWMFKGAIYLNAPPAGGSTAGMDRSQLGPIVHAKCRSESSTTCAESSKKHAEGGFTDDGSPRKRLRS